MVQDKRRHVVIAGLGDTGLLTAVRLSKRYRVTAISSKPCMVSGQELGMRLTQPTFWSREYMLPFTAYKSLHKVQIIQGILSSIDSHNNRVDVQRVQGDSCTLDYDVLLIATGVSNGFWRSADLQSQQDVEKQLYANAEKIAAAKTVAIVGGGATGVSSAANIAAQFKDKEVHLFYSQKQILYGYHGKVRDKLTRHLRRQGVQLHPQHRAVIDEHSCLSALHSGTLQWREAYEPFTADVILWAVGQLKPNSQSLPSQMLTEQGFVNTALDFRVKGYDNIFCVGDIADTDANRCSARNGGYAIAAHNIDCYLRGQPQRYKSFKPVSYRWGSILGVQDNGLTVFTAQGSGIRIPRWAVLNILFPLIVRAMIYKGVRRAST